MDRDPCRSVLLGDDFLGRSRVAFPSAIILKFFGRIFHSHGSLVAYLMGDFLSHSNNRLCERLFIIRQTWLLRIKEVINFYIN
jgi:hypothetical protein